MYVFTNFYQPTGYIVEVFAYFCERLWITTRKY